MAEKKLKEIKSQPENKRAAAYKALAKELNDKHDDAGIVKLVEQVATSEATVGGEVIEGLLGVLTDQNEKINPNGYDPEELIPLLEKIRAAIRPKEQGFPDSLMKLLRTLAQCHESFCDDKKNYREHAKQAAFLLGSFDFEKYQSSAGFAEQVEWFIDTAEFYLDADLSGPASQQVKKAQRIINEIPDKKALQSRFKLCFARVADAERKFLDASMRYLQISQSSEIKEDGKINEALKRSVLCAVLAPAGPRRSRTLAMLYSDERTHSLASFPMLEKMFKGRIIRKVEVESFTNLLLEHQKVTNKQGQSLLQQAVTEHNLLAASQVYRNIHIDQLGVLLDMDAASAEKLAWSMIEQGRMKAVIDQVEGYLEFQHAESGTSSLYSWDSQIQDVCVQVNEAVEAVTKAYPQYKK